MAKKESPNKKEAAKQKPEVRESAKPNALSGISDKAFGVIKFILGLCLLPFVYASTAAFLHEIAGVDGVYRNYFWAGVVAFLIFHLLIGELTIIYDSGHRLLEAIFSFFQPLVKVAPYLLPVYAIIIAALYGVLSLFIKAQWLLQCALILIGFSLTLHLTFSARTVRANKNDFLKGNYIFGFSFVYIVNIAFISLILSLVVSNFFFGDFAGRVITIYKEIFSSLFKQLFLY